MLPGVQRKLFARLVADPQHDRMAAEVERQRESAAAARRRRQVRRGRAHSAEGPCASHGSPTPSARRGSSPASATQGAGSRAFRGRARRSARASRSSHSRLCILQCGIARAAHDDRSRNHARPNSRSREPAGARQRSRFAARQVGRNHGQAEIARRDGPGDASSRGSENPCASRAGHGCNREPQGCA